MIIARFIPEIRAICKLLDKRGLRLSCITGEVKDRDEQVSQFQNNPAVMAFVGQIATAGLGITLTAASTMIFDSLDYSMSNYEQTRARIHRVGQKHPCTYIHLAARGTIDEKVLNDRVILYPGADELGMVLVSRAINALENNTPRVYLKYASTLAPQLIPNYEDRSLNETVKYHVMAAGCIAVPSLSDADVVMGITAPANEMEEAANQPANNINYDVERNMAEFLYFVNDCLKRGIPTAILDNAYTNGGELQLLRVLNKQGILMKLAGYAGWNTSANSMGTVLAMIVNNMYQNNTEAKQNFLVERFIEDFGYGAVVRSYVTEHILPQWGMTYFWCEEQRGKAANAVLEELRKFVKTEMTSVADKVTVEDIFLPWSRMFEIGLKATYKAD